MTRALLESFASPDERAELRALMQAAASLDGERRRVTAAINTLRQRLSQRRLAAERGAPFRRAKVRAGSFPSA